RQSAFAGRLARHRPGTVVGPSREVEPVQPAGKARRKGRHLGRREARPPRPKAHPYNPREQRDERGATWGVWNPALVGLPIDAGYAHITQFIKDVYLDSQVTIGFLSTVTASPD